MSGPKLVIFGATGNTGSCCLTEAIKSNYRVTVLVRDPARLKTTEGFTTIVGDVLNPDDVKRAVSGQDAVVFVVGTNNQTEPTTLFSEGIKNVLQAMTDNNIKRISVCNSAFMFWPIEKVPERLRDLTADHRRQIEVLKESSADWIAVCPPHIAEEPPTGKYTPTVDSIASRRIPKADLAHFLVRCVEPETDQFIGKLVGVASG